MGAVTTVLLTLLRPGQTIAIAEAAYYGHAQLVRLLEPWGLRLVEFDQTGPPPDDADLVLIESPANPILTMPDFEAAAAQGAPVVCDATVASPLRVKPLERGCAVSLHSATKVLAGHDDVLAGVVTVRDDELYERLHLMRRRIGMVASPDSAWLLQRGLRTLASASTGRRRPRGCLRSACASTLPSRRSAIRASRSSSRSTSRRRRRRARRARGADDRERNVPRRRPLEARVSPPLGRRPHPERADAPLGRARGSGGPVGRPRASPRARLRRLRSPATVGS